MSEKKFKANIYLKVFIAKNLDFDVRTRSSSKILMFEKCYVYVLFYLFNEFFDLNMLIEQFFQKLIYDQRVKFYRLFYGRVF